jgi:tRNA modification GTPase
MFATDDTIVAIATPPGRGALGVVRLSGPRALEFAGELLERGASLQPRHATFTQVMRRPGSAEHRRDANADPAVAIDEVIATYFPAPHSYTGEHVVEITGHGSPVLLQAVLKRAIAAGARLAEPGEFTLRAFLNGKRDLIQSEAVADLIDAATPLQARVAFDQLEGTLTERIAAIDARLFDLIARLEASLDFPDEGYHFVEPAHAAAEITTVIAALDDLLAGAAVGRMIREGATAVIAGRPNVGKSSVFNRLAGAERAIVTAIPGTTRDLVTETVDIEGIAVTLVDTAGWRETHDVVESEGVARGTKARGIADLVLLVLDASAPLVDEDTRLLDDTANTNRIVVLNKIDAARDQSPVARTQSPVAQTFKVCATRVSALTGEGFEILRNEIANALVGEERLRDAAPISNARHIALLEQCRASLDAARHAAEAANVPEEFLLIDLQAARMRLDEIVGRRTSEDVLRHIFERFCIGK